MHLPLVWWLCRHSNCGCSRDWPRCFLTQEGLDLRPDYSALSYSGFRAPGCTRAHRHQPFILPRLPGPGRRFGPGHETHLGIRGRIAHVLATKRRAEIIVPISQRENQRHKIVLDLLGSTQKPESFPVLLPAAESCLEAGYAPVPDDLRD